MGARRKTDGLGFVERFVKGNRVKWVKSGGEVGFLIGLLVCLGFLHFILFASLLVQRVDIVVFVLFHLHKAFILSTQL